jgi:D-arginine dehydrogenase
MLAEGIGLQSLTVEAACKMVPALRPDYAVACAIEHDGFDLDVAAIQQGFLRQLRAAGGTLALRSRTGQIERRAGGWDVHTSTGVVFHAPVIINTSGAWGDEVAAITAVRKLGLTPCRRIAAIIDPSPFEAEHWPMINDCAHPGTRGRRHPPG